MYVDGHHWFTVKRTRRNGCCLRGEQNDAMCSETAHMGTLRMAEETMVNGLRNKTYSIFYKMHRIGYMAMVILVMCV